MQQESRVKKSLLNARVNLIFYFLTLALSFFSRKTFLDCLGADFIGLTGTFGSSDSQFDICLCASFAYPVP